MPVEQISWVLPAAKEAYKHRREIQSAWSKITIRLLGKKTRIAFTGMAGAGKTVLFDFLRGEGYKPDYTPPLASQKAEKGKVSAANRKRLSIVVVPGQESQPRHEATDQVFSEAKFAVDGVVHVVSNGFISLRGQYSEETVTSSGYRSPDLYIANQRKAELEDLNATCELIRKSIRVHRKPRWLIVAVAKADLYYDQIRNVSGYYSSDSDSPFVERLQQLVSQVGSDNFRWQAIPVCSWLEDFEWGSTRIPSVLKPNQRDHFLAAFAQLLESYCER